MQPLLPLACLLALATEVAAQGYYLCQNPETGKKVAQDFPCKTGSELRSYAPVSANELKAREETSRQSKRDFERQSPGTYAPEEYMSAEELAVYREKQKEREAERKRMEDEILLRETARRAAQAEQRAIDAERIATEARARATAAEETAARAQQQPLLITPSRLPYPTTMPSPPRPPRCERYNHRGECADEVMPPDRGNRLSPRPIGAEPPLNPEKK